MAISVSLDISVKPERVSEFIGILREALPDTRKRKGFQSITVHQDQDRPDRIFLWERWDTRPDYESYLNWRMETGFMEALGPFLTGDPVFSYFEDVEA